MLAAGMVERSLAVVGTPSINTRILLLPRMEISSFVMLTDEAERRMSIAVPLPDAILADALMVVCSTVDFCATSLAETTTSPSNATSSRSVMVPRLMCDVFGVKGISCFV